MATNRQVAERLREFAENSPETPAPKDRSSGNMTVRSPDASRVEALARQSNALFVLRAEAVSYSTVIGWLVWNIHAKAYEYWQTPTSYSNTTGQHERDFSWGVGWDTPRFITSAVDSPHYGRPRFHRVPLADKLARENGFIDTVDLVADDKRRQWKTRVAALRALTSIVDDFDRIATRDVPEHCFDAVAPGYHPRKMFNAVYDLRTSAAHLCSCLDTGELDAKQAVTAFRATLALSGAWKGLE